MSSHEAGDRASVTLATLARELGVSKSTVSNAYNRPDQLSPALRARILDAARRLGYPGPDPLAATLSRGRVGAIGLVFFDDPPTYPLTFAFTDPVHALFLQGVADACGRAGIGLVLLGGGKGGDLVRAALVDGFICQYDVAGDERFQAVAERGLPVVVVDGPPDPAPGGASSGAVRRVGVDDRGAARAAARHLLELGHRAIGVVAAPLSPDGHDGPAGPRRQRDARYHVIRERLAGYRAEVEAAGLPWAAVPVEERSPYGQEAGRRAAGALLDRPDRPSALLAMSDELALGALRAAEERGLDVPGQLSVVGFDDTPAAAGARPPLTTVHQPHRDKGRIAAELLLRPGTGAATRRTLPADLVVRGSTAPPPAPRR